MNLPIVFKQMFANPALLNDFYKNNEVAELEARLKELEVTEDKAMAEYMQTLQDENLQEFIEENEIEIPEGTTPQEYLLEEGLLEDSVTMQEFVVNELDDVTAIRLELSFGRRLLNVILTTFLPTLLVFYKNELTLKLHIFMIKIEFSV